MLLIQDILHDDEIYIYNQPKTETDIKCNKDCMIRAVSIATDKPYSIIHKMLYEEGWRAVRSRSTGKWKDQIERVLTKLGFQWYWESFPAVKGQSRITPQTFPYETGRYLLQLAGHVVAVKEGKYYDTWNSGMKCVYTALRIQ